MTMSHSSGFTPTMPASSSSIASTKNLPQKEKQRSGRHTGISDGGIAHPCVCRVGLQSAWSSMPPAMHQRALAHAMLECTAENAHPTCTCLQAHHASVPVEVEAAVQVQPLDEQAAQRAVHLRVHAVCMGFRTHRESRA